MMQTAREKIEVSHSTWTLLRLTLGLFWGLILPDVLVCCWCRGVLSLECFFLLDGSACSLGVFACKRFE